MNTEAFVGWALDKARTVEERYTTELIVEKGVSWWHSRRGIHKPYDFDAISERKRQRALNPAYEPRYTEEALRRTAEVAPQIKSWNEFTGHDARPIRDIQVLRFLSELEDVQLHHTEISDISSLAELPRLHTLHFSSHTCRDLRPIGRCRALRDLQLKLFRHWPDVRGLEELPELESLLLQGNLLTFKSAVFPRVKFARLRCEPLEACSVRDLPQVPNCEFLSIGGIETLDGIEAFPRLRNVILETPAESFEPLVQLKALTCFKAKDHEPLDVAPLARVPNLQFLCFNTWNKNRMRPVKPRDLAPLAEAPVLRELEIIGNPLLETEAAAIQAGLQSWDELYLLPEPRPLPAWRLLAWPANKIPHGEEVNRLPGEPELVDIGLRDRELRWAERFLRRAIDRKLGTTDWSEPVTDHSFHTDFHPHIISPTNRSLTIEFNSFGLIDKFPIVVETVRECLARLRGEYHVLLWVRLTVPRRKPTKAQRELQDKFDREFEQAEFERAQREREEYLERLHRYELKKQEGIKVDPKEFAPGEKEPLPVAPWEREDDEDDESNSGDDDGGVAVKEKPDPPPSLYDENDHPLADNYNLMAHFTLSTCYVYNHQRGVAEYLMHRHCDEVIENEKKE
jgi:hypothetical protein